MVSACRQWPVLARHLFPDDWSSALGTKLRTTFKEHLLSYELQQQQGKRSRLGYPC